MLDELTRLWRGWKPWQRVRDALKRMPTVGYIQKRRVCDTIQKQQVLRVLAVGTKTIVAYLPQETFTRLLVILNTSLTNVDSSENIAYYLAYSKILKALYGEREPKQGVVGGSNGYFTYRQKVQLSGNLRSGRYLIIGLHDLKLPLNCINILFLIIYIHRYQFTEN